MVLKTKLCFYLQTWKSWCKSLVSDICYGYCYCIESNNVRQRDGFVKLTYQLLWRILALQGLQKDSKHTTATLLFLSSSSWPTVVVPVLPFLSDCLMRNYSHHCHQQIHVFFVLHFSSGGVPEWAVQVGWWLAEAFLAETYLAHLDLISLQNHKTYLLSVCWFFLLFLSL